MHHDVKSDTKDFEKGSITLTSSIFEIPSMSVGQQKGKYGVLRTQTNNMLYNVEDNEKYMSVQHNKID